MSRAVFACSARDVRALLGSGGRNPLIKLLLTKAGADAAALSAKLGWQQPTTPAALTGLRKAGYEIAGEKPAKGGASKYRIIVKPVISLLSQDQ